MLQHIQKAKEFSTGVASESVLTFEKQYMEKALSADNSFNAPILVAWILKHFNDESVIVKGLHYLLSNCKTGEGCSLVCRHGAVEALIKVHEFFKHHPPIQLAIMSAFRLFVDCNYTRDDVIRDDRVVSLCFSIAHLHMNSLAHVEPAIRCITQCSRRESNRRIIIKHNYIAYLITFSNRFHRVDTLLRSVLKLMNWISTSFERIVYLCKLKGVQFALKCLRAHKARKDVVTAATRFLFKAAEVYSPAIHLILRKGVIVDVIDSIKIGYDDDALQVETIRLLHLLAKTSEGWKQISDVKGGWQIITQGTTIGDALVHDLPGEFNNPGWSIGDTPYLTELDRKKLLATKLSQLSIQPEPTAAWTSFSLTEYMGLSTKGKTLAINTEKQAIYFELISTLNLLPTLREERETWFQRVIVFERESAVKLDEMVQTVQDMRRSDATRRQNIINGASDGDDIMGSVKPVYVLGTQITSASLEKTDDNIIEVLKAKGVI